MFEIGDEVEVVDVSGIATTRLKVGKRGVVIGKETTRFPPDPPTKAPATDGAAKSMRTFDTGATRDSDNDKIDPEGFLSPLVIKRYCEYMHEHRKQPDGSTRSADNWQRGMPLESYMQSLWRHMLDVWLIHRGYTARGCLSDALCGVMFNAMGYLHEIQRGEADAEEERVLNELISATESKQA